MKEPVDELSDLAAEVSLCRLCPLAGTRTRAVPGEGPARAKVLMIGEAPGRDEDLSGRPFVGRAGTVLGSELEAQGRRRDEVYITNVVKCRPPRNRVPRRSERETCKSTYLDRELDLVGPQLVVLLGRTATVSVLGVATLKEVRGKRVRKEGMVYLPTYHPAAILRNPRLKTTFQKDLRTAFLAQGSKESD